MQRGVEFSLLGIIWRQRTTNNPAACTSKSYCDCVYASPTLPTHPRPPAFEQTQRLLLAFAWGGLMAEAALHTLPHIFLPHPSHDHDDRGSSAPAAHGGYTHDPRHVDAFDGPDAFALIAFGFLLTFAIDRVAGLVGRGGAVLDRSKVSSSDNESRAELQTRVQQAMEKPGADVADGLGEKLGGREDRDDVSSLAPALAAGDAPLGGVEHRDGEGSWQGLTRYGNPKTADDEVDNRSDGQQPSAQSATCASASGVEGLTAGEPPAPVISTGDGKRHCPCADAFITNRQARKRSHESVQHD